jgi:hypothetical protein
VCFKGISILCLQRNERVESALEGFETVQYIPPVVRVEEDEDYEELGAEKNTSASLPSPASESEDIFAQFFSASDGRLLIFYIALAFIISYV